MKLSNAQILQIDASILIGLLIFLTFQSFVSTTYDEQFNVILAETRKISIERDLAEDYLLRNCSPFQEKGIESLYNATSHDILYSAEVLRDRVHHHPYLQEMSSFDSDVPSNCKEWQYRLYEIHLQRYATEQWLNDLNVTFNKESSPTFNQFFSTVAFFSTGAKMMSVLITVIMIIPFALSAIIIVSDSIYKKEETNESDLPKKLVIAGFVAMIVGFSFLMVIVTCGTFPALNCFNVGNLFQQPH